MRETRLNGTMVIVTVSKQVTGPTLYDDRFVTTGDPEAMRRSAELAFGVVLRQIGTAGVA